MAFGFTSWEKAILTHVKVEAPETSVPEKYKKMTVMKFMQVFSCLAVRSHFEEMEKSKIGRTENFPWSVNKTRWCRLIVILNKLLKVFHEKILFHDISFFDLKVCYFQTKNNLDICKQKRKPSTKTFKRRSNLLKMSETKYTGALAELTFHFVNLTKQHSTFD